MDLRRILSYVRRCVADYDMIEEGDHIAVGVSAGKDSLTLLCALAAMRRFYPKHYTLSAITVDMGFPGGTDLSAVAELCRTLDVPFYVVKTEIYTVVFDIRKEKNPCALCATLRRGALYGKAVELGCRVVALGHHFDDAVNTLLLNLFYEGRIGCFQPVTDLSRTGVRMIRPMLYVPEKEVRAFAARENLPVVKSPCPADGNTRRATVAQLVKDLERENKGLRYRIFGAMQRAGLDGFREVPGGHRMPAPPQNEPDDAPDEKPKT